MKRVFILAFTLLFCLLSITLIACGNYEEESREDEKENSSNQENPHSHSYGNWQTVTEPTCSKKGIRRQYCSCDEYIDEEIPATGVHEYELGKCKQCKAEQPESQGLKFELNTETDTYMVTGIGTCTDKSLVIPRTYEGKSVTSIGYKAFYDDYSLTSITIPNSVVSIGKYAFDDCVSLEGITIPNSITSIGGYAFSGCTSLKYNEYGNAFYLGNDNNPHLVLVEAKNESIFSCIINENTKIISVNAFSGCTSLTSIKIPSSVTSIGDYAFEDCSSLAGITIGNGVTSIGDYAFDNCSSLESVNYLGTNERWCNISFSNAYANPLYYAKKLCLNGELVTDLVIPNTVTKIKDYAFYNCDSLTSISIPDSITMIGYSAFKGCTSLKYNEYDNAYYLGNDTNPYVVLIKVKDTSITSCIINENTKFIHSNAFLDCDKLTSINHLGTIEQWCNISFGNAYSNPLYYTKQLCLNGELVTDLVIPNTVNEIKPYTFYNYTSLTNIEIPNSVTSIGGAAFSGCTSFTSIKIPSSVTSIGRYAFSGCTSLTSVTIPNSVISIGDYAFEDCSSLAGITIGNSVTSIGHNAFEDCYKLANVTIGNSVTSIGRYAFSGCTSLTSVTIPNSVISIGDYAFEVCSSLRRVNYLGTIECWCNISFSDAHSNPLNYAQKLYLNGTLITDLVIPSTVTEIKDYAFHNCCSLTSVTIPNSVKTIGEDAFGGCTKLVEVYNLSSLNITKGSEDNGYVGSYAKAIHTSFDEPSILETTSDGYVFAYISNSEIYLVDYLGNTTELTLPDGYKGNNYGIYKYAFFSRNDIAKVTIPNSIISIGDLAFCDCYKLANVTIGNSVTSIGRYAFSGCTSLTNIMIPDSITSIGRDAFYKCTSLTYNKYNNAYYLGKDTNPYVVLMKATYQSFTSCVINVNTKIVYNSAFLACDSLKSIVIPNSVTSIGEEAFAYCGSLASVTIPNSVTSIEEYAFAYCDSLTSIEIPNSVTSIGRSAFKDCPIESATIPTNAISCISNDELKTAIINGGTSIEKYAFAYCDSLASVTIPSGVTLIEYGAFDNCPSLTRVIFENPNGWWYATSSSATSGMNISSSDLSKTSTAAEYLRDTYAGYYWKRS